MSETANKIYQSRNESKSLNEVAIDVLSKFQAALTKFLPAITLALIGIVSSVLFYAIVSLNPTYIYQLAPALAIILMVGVLRFFSIPVKVQSKQESNK